MKKECKVIVKKLKKEQKELNKKIRDLDAFMDTAQFEMIPTNHKDLLSIQLLQMAAYSNTLNARIHDLKAK